jgi:hypothetical protein
LVRASARVDRSQTHKGAQDGVKAVYSGGSWFRYLVSLVAIILILLVEAADVFSRGTTIQNRGNIHAGYDGTAGTNHVKNSCLLATQSNITAARSSTEFWLPKAR